MLVFEPFAPTPTGFVEGGFKTIWLLGFGLGLELDNVLFSVNAGNQDHR